MYKPYSNETLKSVQPFIVDMEDRFLNTCEYGSCESEAYRFFWNSYFCNEHNWYLRARAKKEVPDDLDEWIKNFI